MIPDFENDERAPVRLQSDQFIVHPIQVTKPVIGDTKEYQVDLSLQCCQCSDFIQYRSKMPIGDPRRFCRHMVQVQAEYSDGLHTFVQSLFDASGLSDRGLPNGASCAFFEIDGRLAFVGENRDRTTYFFVTGRGNSFHEFVYERAEKKWIGGKPDDPAPLLKFAFQSRSEYGDQLNPAKTNTRKKQSSQRRETQHGSDSNFGRYLMLAVVTIALATGGYYYFQNKDKVDEFVQKKLGQEVANDLPTEESTPSSKTKSRSEKSESNKTRRPDKTTKPIEKQAADGQVRASEPTNPKGTGPIAKPSEPKAEVRLPEYRNWNYADGSFYTSARYKSYQNGTITLVRQDDQTEIKVDKSELSEQDQDHVKALLRERRLEKSRRQKRLR